jgi:hypothetical protein
MSAFSFDATKHPLPSAQGPAQAPSGPQAAPTEPTRTHGDAWNQWAQAAAQAQPAAPDPTTQPVADYARTPGRWDAHDPKHRMPGESDYMWEVRRRQAARYWADEDAKAGEQASNLEDIEERKRRINRESQARWRAKQRAANGAVGAHNVVSPVVQAAYQELQQAKAEQALAVAAWKVKVANLEHALLMAKAQANLDAARAAGGAGLSTGGDD